MLNKSTKSIISFESKIFLLIAVSCVILLLISHLFFQKYLFMQPCEQCVYIRFYFCIITFGALVAMPKWLLNKILGFIFIFYGACSGIYHSIILNKIHNAINNNGDIFGLSGCSLTPQFPFNLALNDWFPSLFTISGDCGVDTPKIPNNIELDSIQQYFTSLYSNGWYLIPQLKMLNMAECCMIAFGFIIILASFLCIKILIARLIRLLLKK